MTSTCQIRALEEGDLTMVRGWRNHLTIVRSRMLTQHEISQEEHAAWFDRVSRDNSRQLLIVEDDQAPIGYVQFNGVVVEGIANWGFYARPNAPKGSGGKLCSAALDHAFGSLRLHKICGQVIASNHASIALHRKLGFLQEGILRDHQRICGTYHDVFWFGLLEDEWRTGMSGFGEAR